MPLCKEDKIAVMPWSPLAAGRLARPWGKRTSVPKLMQSQQRYIPQQLIQID